ncbi:unnamed protein product [Durusdinium trenchii]|uniref:Uncharacterized protein n=1 Tax=Durusdinium trenchii TaxID=1381693 RepID=A0ABP0M114_9DINO
MAASALSLMTADYKDFGRFYDADSDATTTSSSDVAEVSFDLNNFAPEDFAQQLQRRLRHPAGKMIAPPPKEPAPLFIEESLPPSMKVATPLVAYNLNPFLPAKKRPSFAEELGASQGFLQFTWEPAVIRTSDLSAF